MILLFNFHLQTNKQTATVATMTANEFVCMTISFSTILPILTYDDCPHGVNKLHHTATDTNVKSIL